MIFGDVQPNSGNGAKVFGDVPQAPQQAQPQKPGFLQSAVQSIAQPFLQGARYPLGLIQKGVGAITGNQVDKDNANKLLSDQPMDFGAFGKVNQVGKDEKGQSLGFGGSLAQATGAGAQIAPWFVGAGEANSLLQPAKSLGYKAAETGLSGALVGGSAGFGGELQSQAEKNQGFDWSKIAQSTAQGTGTGALGGVATAGIFGQFANKANTTLDDTLSMTEPTLNKKGRIQALKMSGQPGGITTEGNTMARIPNQYDKDVAQAALDAGVSKTKNVPQNISALGDKIGETMQPVLSYLDQNPSAFNSQTLGSYLRSQPPTSYLASDAEDAAYTRAREQFLNFFNKGGESGQRSYPGTLRGLWQARSDFDDFIQKAVSRDPATASAVELARKDIRNSVNDFIADNLPNGSVYKNGMKQTSLLFRAADRIAEKNQSVVGQNLLKNRLSKVMSNPLVKYGTTLAAGGGLVEAGMHFFGGNNNQ